MSMLFYVDGIEGCNLKIFKYRKMSRVILLAIACLLLSCNVVTGSQVDSAESGVQQDLYKEVKTRAAVSGSPAITTKAFLLYVEGGKEAPSTPYQLNWENLNGFQIGHSRSEDLSELKELAEKNERVLSSVGSKIRKNTDSVKVDADKISSSGFISMFSYTCLVSINWRVKNEMKFTISSGGPIPVKEACRLFAWAFAANGIEFTISEEKPKTLVLDEKGMQRKEQ